MDDHFFPDSAPEAVGEIVHFIHHHVAEVFQKLTVRIEHVAQDFCRHNHNPRVRVDAGIPSEQADFIRAVALD